MKYQISSGTKEGFLNSNPLYYWHIRQDIMKTNKTRLRHKNYLLKIY